VAENPFDPQLQLMRKLVLTPCSSKEGLRQWCRFYLKLDFPDQRIDADSTGSPLDSMWEVYYAGVNRIPLKTEDGEDARRVMWYASRDSYKTLGASVMELLFMLHMDRNVVHMAAIEQQAGKAQEYLRNFLDCEYVDEFKVGDNKRTIAVLWFEHKQTGNILTNDEWKVLGGRATRHDYYRHVHYVKVLVNTAQSANSDHTAAMVIDEVDLIRFPKAYDQAKAIPSTQKDVYGRLQPPITLLTSTRKSGGGLVQREIDEQRKTKTLIRHWNILDVTGHCPDTRTKRSLPVVKVHYSDDTLRTYTPEAFEDLKTSDPKAASKCAEAEAFQGCSKCSIYAACRGRLADQKSDSGLLKDVFDTIAKFDEFSIEMAIAELLCRKPGNEGAIYARFSRETHMLDARAMWKTISGRDPPPGPVSRDALIALLFSLGATPFAGIDWGTTHCFAVVTGWVFGRIIYILDAFEIPGLDVNQCVEICDSRIKKWNPVCYPDTAYPSYIMVFRKAGYQMRTHKKDVIGGIEAVRAKMMPVGNRPPEMYLLKGDEGCEHLTKRLVGYRWKLDAKGDPTDIPEEKDDDLCDASRYLIQNVFKNSGKISTTSVEAERKVQAGSVSSALQPYTPENWATKTIQELTGVPHLEPGLTVTKAREKRVKKGLFVADFS
jgi:hypothetical protein